jgi:hypothetical protein
MKTHEVTPDEQHAVLALDETDGVPVRAATDVPVFVETGEETPTLKPRVMTNSNRSITTLTAAFEPAVVSAA